MAGPAESTAVAEAILPPGRVVEAAGQDLQARGAVPTDGRLRGPDYAATITRVAWPQSVASVSDVFDPPAYVAGPGHRLVDFTLSVTQPPADSGQLNGSTEVIASLMVGNKQMSIPLDMIDGQIADGMHGSAEATGTDSFVASVPADNHSVALELTEGGFTQQFNLWTLQRLPPSPVVLYRDPKSSTVTGTTGAPFHLASRIRRTDSPRLITHRSRTQR